MMKKDKKCNRVLRSVSRIKSWQPKRWYKSEQCMRITDTTLNSIAAGFCEESGTKLDCDASKATERCNHVHR